MAAAREMTGNGGVPTVAEVAERAEVSQATAYRYFPTQESLLAEAALATDVTPIEAAIAQGGEIADPEDALALVVRAIHAACAANELPWRRLLSRSLERPPAAGLEEERRRGVGRQGRRLTWMTATLESRRSAMPPRVFNQLIQALTTLTGIEALVTLRDVCNLSLDEAGDVREWGARALLSAAFEKREALATEQQVVAGKTLASLDNRTRPTICGSGHHFGILYCEDRAETSA